MRSSRDCTGLLEDTLGLIDLNRMQYKGLSGRLSDCLGVPLNPVSLGEGAPSCIRAPVDTSVRPYSLCDAITYLYLTNKMKLQALRK